jgi:pimeloyl-ACP methyl ester carboxylesterase
MVATMKGFPGLTVTASEAKASATPAFITVGGKDPLAPLSRALARQWPRATFVEVADANHQTILGAPEVMAGIRGVLTTADVPSPRRPQE